MLVGREQEQQVVDDLLCHAMEGQSGVLAIVGEPGIGKSTLLAYAESAAQGMRVLRARCVESEAQIPFSGLLELLRPVLGGLSRIPGPQAEALEGAFALRPPRAEDRFAVGAATLSLLATSAEESPLLVVVDDAHWVDGSSADALVFAVRRLVADRIAVLFGVREGERSVLLGAGLPTLSLDGVDRAAAGKILTHHGVSRVADETVDRLVTQTGGNPLALIEVAGDFGRFGQSPPLDTPLPVATTLADAYLRRCRSLPVATLELLLLAAVNDTGDLGVLSRAAGHLSLDLVELAPAEAAGLVTVSESRLEFRHPLLRSAVYSGATPYRRRECHRALAGALPDTDADRRAWHLALAALGTDEAAASALEQAGHRARQRSAYDVASRAFERSAGLAPDEVRQGRLLYQAGDAAWLGGDPIRAMALLDEAARRVGSGADLDVDHLRGRISLRLGPVRNGQRILVLAAGRAAHRDVEQAVIMLAEAVNAGFYAGDAASMVDAARRITELVPRINEDRTLFFASMARGMAWTFSGETEGGAAELRHAVAIAERVPEFADDPRLLAWAAMGPLWLRDAHSGRGLIESALTAARRRVAIGLLPHLLSMVAIDQAATDQWPEAEAGFHEVIALAREANERTDLAVGLARLAWLEARQGRESLCRAHAEEAFALSCELGLALCEIWATAGLGDLEFGLGQPAAAVVHFERQQELLAELGVADADLSAAPELVELYLRLGESGRAAATAARFDDVARDKGRPWATARAARCRGLVATDAAFDREFAMAFEAHGDSADTFEVARTHLAYGVRLRRSRRRVEARGELREAMDHFDQLGAEPWSRMVRVELAATGETARQRDPSTRNHLTPQEMQIALLLAAGRTTREAASTLFLSPKTIEYHLRNVYRKLSIGSREELAASMADIAPSTALGLGNDALR